MTTYIKLSTQEFPRYPGDIAIDPAGAEDYAVVYYDDALPAYDPYTQRPALAKPILVDGVWRSDWELVALTPEEQYFYKKVQEGGLNV